MKKLFLILLFIPLFFDAQINYGKWQDYFSYFNVLDFQESEDKIFAITTSGLFSYDKTTYEIEKISKTTGLSGVDITASAYDNETGVRIIAYKNGAFDVFDEEGKHYFVDIPIDNDFQGDKSVNHIFIDGENAVFSMDFGLAVFNITRLEFDETTYFRNGFDYYVVNSASIVGDLVVASSENGIYTHPIDDLLPDFDAWLHYFAGEEFLYTTVFKNEVFASDGSKVVQSADGVSYVLFPTQGNIVHLNSGLNYLSVIHPQGIETFDASFGFAGSTSFSQSIQSGISTDIGVFGGTQFEGMINALTSEKIAPDGPFNNTSYSLTLYEDQLYVAPGGRNIDNFFLAENIALGYYHFDGVGWKHIEHNAIQQGNLMEVAINPLNTEEIYLAGYRGQGGGGVVKMESDIFDIKYVEANSSIVESTHQGQNFIAACSNAFDDTGNLYVVQSYSQNLEFNNLNIRSVDGQWLNIPLSLPGTSTSFIYLDDDGWMWLGSPRPGGELLAYDFNGTLMNPSDDVYYLLKEQEGSGNLPEGESITCITKDKNGVLWVGSRKGIRIKRNPNKSIEEGDLDTELIIIVQDNIPEEFLKDVIIYDIAVDEANNKWIATSAGVFYVSDYGQETIEFFDASNSPLPNNIVTDVEIDSKSGKVYFVCPKGIVSYQGDYVESTNEFGKIIVYPNPVRPGFKDRVVIKGLANNAKVKITDINGNLVHQGVARGGAIYWDQTNLQGNLVASGIYIALMLNENNLVSASTKIAIVR